MKQKITVELKQAPDFPLLFEVTNITDDDGALDYCPVVGLGDSGQLEIGSWLRKSELMRRGIRSKNKHMNFVIF